MKLKRGIILSAWLILSVFLFCASIYFATANKPHSVSASGTLSRSASVISVYEDSEGKIYPNSINASEMQKSYIMLTERGEFLQSFDLKNWASMENSLRHVSGIGVSAIFYNSVMEKWCVYASVSLPQGGYSVRMFLSDSPFQPFSFVSQEVFYSDACIMGISVFCDEDGKTYLIYTVEADGVYGLELNPVSGMAFDRETVFRILSGGERAFLLKKDGRYVLFLEKEDTCYVYRGDEISDLSTLFQKLPFSVLSIFQDGNNLFAVTESNEIYRFICNANSHFVRSEFVATETDTIGIDLFPEEICGAYGLRLSDHAERKVALEPDGSLSGVQNGAWQYFTTGEAEIIADGVVYYGLFLRQKITDYDLDTLTFCGADRTGNRMLSAYRYPSVEQQTEALLHGISIPDALGAGAGIPDAVGNGLWNDIVLNFTYEKGVLTAKSEGNAVFTKEVSESCNFLEYESLLAKHTLFPIPQAGTQGVCISFDCDNSNHLFMSGASFQLPFGARISHFTSRKSIVINRNDTVTFYCDGIEVERLETATASILQAFETGEIWFSEAISNVVVCSAAQKNVVLLPQEITCYAQLSGAVKVGNKIAEIPQAVRGISVSFSYAKLKSDWTPFITNGGFTANLSVLYTPAGNFYEEDAEAGKDFLNQERAEIFFTDRISFATVSFYENGAVSFYRDGKMALRYSGDLRADVDLNKTLKSQVQQFLSEISVSGITFGTSESQFQMGTPYLSNVYVTEALTDSQVDFLYQSAVRNQAVYETSEGYYRAHFAPSYTQKSSESFAFSLESDEVLKYTVYQTLNSTALSFSLEKPNGERIEFEAFSDDETLLFNRRNGIPVERLPDFGETLFGKSEISFLTANGSLYIICERTLHEDCFTAVYRYAWEEGASIRKTDSESAAVSFAYQTEFLEANPNPPEPFPDPPIGCAANGHAYVLSETRETCTDDGYATFRCTVCEQEFTAVHAESARGHLYAEPIWSVVGDSATATFSCSSCLDEQRISANLQFENTLETCVKDGMYRSFASVLFCGKEYRFEQTKIVPMTGHTGVRRYTHVAGSDCHVWICENPCCEGGEEICRFETTVSRPSCDQAGEEISVCVFCGYQKISNLAAGEHDYLPPVWGEWTLESDGGASISVTFTCSHGDDHRILNALVTTSEKKATCTQRGETVYRAIAVFQGIDYIQEKYVDQDALGHRLFHYSAKEPTCNLNGNLEYWKCLRCYKLYSDEKACCEVFMQDVRLPARGHEFLFHAAVASTCTASGYEAFYECAMCAKLYADEDGATEILEPVLISPKGHRTVEYSAVPPTCTQTGIYAYFKCSECLRLFSDRACNHEIAAPIMIAAKGHDLCKHAAIDASCTQEGHAQFWSCNLCDALFSDGKGINQISSVQTIPPRDHQLQHVSSVLPTCTSEGISDHWKCFGCEKVFNADGQEIPLPVIPPNGHRFGEWIITIEPTETREGEATRQCSFCDFRETRSVAALGEAGLISEFRNAVAFVQQQTLLIDKCRAIRSALICYTKLSDEAKETVAEDYRILVDEILSYNAFVTANNNRWKYSIGTASSYADGFSAAYYTLKRKIYQFFPVECTA